MMMMKLHHALDASACVMGRLRHESDLLTVGHWVEFDPEFWNTGTLISTSVFLSLSFPHLFLCGWCRHPEYQFPACPFVLYYPSLFFFHYGYCMQPVGLYFLPRSRFVCMKMNSCELMVKWVQHY